MFHIIGSGACGFLRAYQTFKNHTQLKYKGGGPKYQNSFENWSNDGLIWDSDTLTKKEKLRRVSLHNTITNITHSYLKYVPEFIELNPQIKFLCLKGRKDHSIKSLAISWGYRNPCYVGDRSLGIGHNRYAVDQFPNLSSSHDEFEATEKYWEEYYAIASQWESQYPNNFIIVDSPKFFGDFNYRKSISKKINIDLSNDPLLPVDFSSWNITTTLHGGLGNILFQMGEVISFCEKNNIEKPFFGNWDLYDGEKYPPSYNSDRLLGGHFGDHNIIKETFPNLDWRGDLKCTYDTKFVINDMFRFSDSQCLDIVRKNFKITDKKNLNTAALHLRFCTQSVDDHVNGYIDDSFYVECFKKIPSNVKVYVFSDDNEKAVEKIKWFESNFSYEFSLVRKNSFQSLKMMVECEYHILHVSTFSFWSAFLDIHQPNNKVLYPESFVGCHSINMIPYEQWQMI